MSNQLDIESIRKVIMDNAAQVEYRAEKHQYFWDGVEWASVHKLLRPITDEELRTVPADRLEMARERGTMVHEAIDRYLSTGFDLSKGDTALYMKQFKRFMKEHKVVVIAHEVKVRNYVYGVAGRADMVAILQDEDVIRPVDYKVTYEIAPSVALQLNFYESCLYSYKLPVAEGVVLHLELEDYKLVPAGEVADRDMTVATARGLVSVNAFKMRYGKGK